ncbi:Tripartite tricarboxylate transporter TctB family protein [Brevibacterium linens]|uniref:Tripartite tricarboxylate transporter TctB family protein n=2 Tax=Brevibacterium linens TaxID=1703 RepID=A0A2H1KGE7_BRELN|nr:Tripartite tricarboxylate transporter TctB family protein [Brevibacterium linens]
MTTVFALQSVWKIAKSASNQTETSNAEDTAPSSWRFPNSVLKVVVAVGLTAFYVLVFEPLGFLIGTAVYLWLLSLLFKDGWKPTGKSVVLGLVFGIVSSVVLNTIFVYILSVLLPIGLLGF